MIVIVGHGKSTEGRGWGDRIDAADVVIRMWNCGFQWAEDYGTKYDWGLIETHRRLLGQWRKGTEPVPARGYVCSILDHWKDNRNELPPGTSFIEQEKWLSQKWVRALNGVGATGRWELTRGGIAAYWAMENAEPGEQIVLVGFDNIRAGYFLPVEEAFSQRYQDAPLGAWLYPDYHPMATKHGNHDVIAEARLLKEMAKRSGVDLIFAQDVWP